MGIFPQGLQGPFLQQQPHRIDARADAQLATGAGHLGVDGLGRLAGQSRDGFAAVMSRHIGHDLSLALGEEARKRTIRRKLRRHETRLAARLHRVHAERRSRGRQGFAQVVDDRMHVVGGATMPLVSIRATVASHSSGAPPWAVTCSPPGFAGRLQGRRFRPRPRSRRCALDHILDQAQALGVLRLDIPVLRRPTQHLVHRDARSPHEVFEPLVLDRDRVLQFV